MVAIDDDEIVYELGDDVDLAVKRVVQHQLAVLIFVVNLRINEAIE